MSALLVAALEYQREGRRVIPLFEVHEDGRCACKKGAGCESAGKHPRVEWAGIDTADEAAVRKWWQRWPEANIGVLTGGNLAVLDVDPRSDGDKALAELEAKHGPLPETAEVATGGNGSHRYYAVPEGTPSRTLASGLELKAEGGLVVAPPSIHASGREYVWLDRSPPAPGPEWLLADAHKRRNGLAPVIANTIPRTRETGRLQASPARCDGAA